VVPAILVIAPLQAAAMIVMEATLSFLGLGVQPPTPSWGGILLEGKPYLRDAWWLTTLPGLTIALTCAVLIGLGQGISAKLTGNRRRRVDVLRDPLQGEDSGEKIQPSQEKGHPGRSVERK